VASPRDTPPPHHARVRLPSQSPLQLHAACIAAGFPSSESLIVSNEPPGMCFVSQVQVGEAAVSATPTPTRDGDAAKRLDPAQPPSVTVSERVAAWEAEQPVEPPLGSALLPLPGSEARETASNARGGGGGQGRPRLELASWRGGSKQHTAHTTTHTPHTTTHTTHTTAAEESPRVPALAYRTRQVCVLSPSAAALLSALTPVPRWCLPSLPNDAPVSVR
jgi:hypothetical protein